MQQTQKFTAIIELEDDGYVSLCPELDIASQGSTIEEAKQNLGEAIELFLEVADSSETARRLKKETFITQLE
ncbi:MAG: type II toxin-antitoxin system HicB family antitoxin, partial [Cyanobacteria bacterium P01_F01_bin.143]